MIEARLVNRPLILHTLSYLLSPIYLLSSISTNQVLSPSLIVSTTIVKHSADCVEEVVEEIEGGAQVNYQRIAYCHIFYHYHYSLSCLKKRTFRSSARILREWLWSPLHYPQWQQQYQGCYRWHDNRRGLVCVSDQTHLACYTIIRRMLRSFIGAIRYYINVQYVIYFLNSIHL